MKTGDIVYCIDETTALELHIPYVVNRYMGKIIMPIITIKGVEDSAFYSKSFISEREYMNIKYYSKINKLLEDVNEEK